MEDAGGVGPRAHRKHLSHQTCRHRPFAADADRHQKPQDRDLPQVGRKKRQSGEERIQEDRQNQNRPPAITIGQRAGRQTANHPAEQKDGKQNVAPVFDVTDAALEQLVQHLVARDREGLTFVDVEYPARRSDRQHQPLIARHARIPRFVVGRGGVRRQRVASFAAWRLALECGE